MNSVELSIIIVNFNARNYLEKCLAAITATIKEIAYEIILVDNHSSDQSVNFVRKNFPNVRLVINDDNAGFAKANNQGIQFANGDSVLLLNPDTELQEGTVLKMIAYAHNDKRVGIVGCKVINPKNKLQWDSCGCFLTPFTLLMKESGIEKIFPNNRLAGKRLMRYWSRTTSRSIDWISGVCMLIRKKVITDIGAMDERFFAYMEDMDLCRRASRKNWMVYFLGNATVFHNLSTSWQQRSEKHLLIALQSEKKYFVKYYGTLGALYFKKVYFMGCYFRFLFNILVGDRKKAKDHYRTMVWLLTNRL